MECRVNKLATPPSMSQITTRNSSFAQQYRVGCVRDNITHCTAPLLCSAMTVKTHQVTASNWTSKP